MCIVKGDFGMVPNEPETRPSGDSDPDKTRIQMKLKSVLSDLFAIIAFASALTSLGMMMYGVAHNPSMFAAGFLGCFAASLLGFISTALD